MTENERIAQLTADAQKGDTGAFESLYAAFGKRVYYFCRGILGDDAAATEATRDAFLYAWRNIRSLQAGQTFYRWICGNAFYFSKIALASLRGQGITVNEADGDPSLFDRMNATDGAPLAEPSLRRSDLSVATALLDALPDEERICVLLYDYAAFSVEEAASVAGCSAETLKCLVYNAHVALCDGLNAHSEGLGDSLRPYLGRLLRTCGRNCSLPDAVTEGLRAGLKESDEDDFASHEANQPEGTPFSLSKKTTTALYILIAAMLVGAIAYVIYWFVSAPDAGSDDTSSGTQSEVSVAGSVSKEESAVSEESSPNDFSFAESTVSDESEPAESSDGISEPAESSEETSSEEISSGEVSQPPQNVPAELPRTTANLRLRSAPDTSDPNNLITTIPANTHIEILETVTAADGSAWYYVRYTVASGMWHEGYCSADYVETGE